MIVTLCGSARFEAEFKEWTLRLGLAGIPAFTLSRYLSDHGAGFTSDDWTTEEKIVLDMVHRRKIDASDAILVLNVGGYVGDSTKSEIRHAADSGKAVFWLEPDKAGLAGNPLYAASNANGADVLFDVVDQLVRTIQRGRPMSAADADLQTKAVEIRARLENALGWVCAIITQAEALGITVDFTLGVNPKTKEGEIAKLIVRAPV